MSNTDFFDDDLKTDTPVEMSVKPQREANADSGTDNQLTRLTRHRDHVEGQVASTVRDIERLRQRQEDLEREKRELEALRRRQDDYEASKRKMLHQLRHSLLALEKEEVRAGQLTNLYGSTRVSFRDMMAEIERINETTWSEEELQDELERAQLVVDSIRVECSKALAKIDAVVAEGRPNEPDSTEEGLADEMAPAKRPGFGYWFMVGLAIAIPLLVALTGAGVLVQWLLLTLFK